MPISKKQSFEFKTRRLELTISGHVFRVDDVATVADKLLERVASIKELIPAFVRGEKTGGDLVATCKEIIDDVLGPRAFDVIFSEREPNVLDCAAVLEFIAAEITVAVKRRK